MPCVSGEVAERCNVTVLDEVRTLLHSAGEREVDTVSTLCRFDLIRVAGCAGQLPVRRVAGQGVGFPVDKEDDIHTSGGRMVDRIGHVQPEPEHSLPVRIR